MTAGVLQARHPRARVASLVVDLARARVESQVADLVHLLATGAHPTSGVSLGYYYPSFLYLFSFAHTYDLSFFSSSPSPQRVIGYGSQSEYCINY